MAIGEKRVGEIVTVPEAAPEENRKYRVRPNRSSFARFTSLSHFT